MGIGHVARPAAAAEKPGPKPKPLRNRNWCKPKQTTNSAKTVNTETTARTNAHLASKTRSGQDYHAHTMKANTNTDSKTGQETPKETQQMVQRTKVSGSPTNKILRMMSRNDYLT